MGSQQAQIEELYRIFDKIDFAECFACSTKCCYLPWLLEEELERCTKEIEGSIMKTDSVSFIKDTSKCNFVKEHMCSIYSERPLDCRLFPLDVIEENGEYYWCVFTVCSKHAEISKKLIDIIPALEENISETIFEQYKKQIAVTKELYIPYKLKQYEKVKPFRNPVKASNRSVYHVS